MTTLKKKIINIDQIIEEHAAFYLKVGISFDTKAFKEMLSDKLPLIEKSTRFYHKPKVLCLEPMMTRTNPRLLVELLGIKCTKEAIAVLSNMRNSKFHFPHITVTEGLLNMSEGTQHPETPRMLFKESTVLLKTKVKNGIAHVAARGSHSALMQTYFAHNKFPRETLLIEEYLLLNALMRPRILDGKSYTILVKELKIKKIGNEEELFVPILGTKMYGAIPELFVSLKPIDSPVLGGYYRKSHIYKPSLV